MSEVEGGSTGPISNPRIRQPRTPVTRPAQAQIFENAWSSPSPGRSGPRDGDDRALTKLRARRLQLAALGTDSRADGCGGHEFDAPSPAARITFVTSSGLVMC